MARPAPIAKLGSEFDSFLFASIGEERNDMQLSVLSVLARSNVDPWEEAAILARLPEAAATQRLASLIAALPGRATTHPDPRTIAARLIRLLPRQTRRNARSWATVPGVGEVIHPRALMYGIVAFMAVMLGAQIIIASYQPPVHVAGAQMSRSTGAAPQTPLPGADQ
jgi:hypothetical protein